VPQPVPATLPAAMTQVASWLGMPPPAFAVAQKAWPNLSLNRSANGRAPWPRGSSGSSSAARPRRPAVVARLALR
jgi:hypothetical protein